MINKLVTDIKNYILFLEENNMYVSIHTDFTEYMLPLLEFNIHKNPRCLVVKSDNTAWERCIKHHSTMRSKDDVKEITCYAGVEETVFFLECGGTVCVSGKPTLDNDRTKTMLNPLCRMIEYLKTICPEVNEISDNELVNRASKFMQRNFYNSVSNKDIADACACSVSTLCHMFKKVTGQSVQEYVCGLRIEYAKKLLKTSNMSVATVALKSGFSDYNYFAVKFKKITGSSPSKYRNS